MPSPLYGEGTIVYGFRLRVQRRSSRSTVTSAASLSEEPDSTEEGAAAREEEDQLLLVEDFDLMGLPLIQVTEPSRMAGIDSHKKVSLPFQPPKALTFPFLSVSLCLFVPNFWPSPEGVAVLELCSLLTT